MKIAEEHIQEWVRSNKAAIISMDVASQFGQYLDGLAWNIIGTGLDWTRIDGVEVNLSDMTDEGALNKVRQTPFGRDPYIVFLYRYNEPCIACRTEFALSNIDYAFWKAPGRQYMFGASFDDGVLQPRFDHFAEYDGGDWLRIAAR